MTVSVLVWTPSGSCPLCLTPPCYQLQKPPILRRLFFWPSSSPRRKPYFALRLDSSPSPSNDLFIISRHAKMPVSGVNRWCEGVNHGGAFAGRRRVGAIERTADQFGGVQHSVPGRHGSGRGDRRLSRRRGPHRSQGARAI